jgi:hypothetical protein
MGKSNGSPIAGGIGQGASRFGGTFHPTDSAELAKIVEVAQLEVAAQDERYQVVVDVLGTLGTVRFTKKNKSVEELKPDVVYVSIPALLKIAGQLLTVMDYGQVGAG